MVAVGVLAPALPLLLAPLIDAGSNNEYLLPPKLIPYAFLIITVMQSVFSYGRGYLGGWLDVTLQRDFRNDMGTHLLHLPMSQLQKESPGLITSRFMVFLPNVTGSIMPVCMALVQESVKIISYIAILFYWQWQLMLLVLTIAPIITLVIRHMRQRMNKATGNTQEFTATSQSRLNETLQLTPIIKTQGGKQATHRLVEAFASLRNASLRVAVILSSSQPITQLLLAIPFSLVVAYVINALITKTMTAGTVAAFMTTMVLLSAPIRNITRAVNILESMLTAAKEVFYFLDLPAEADTGRKTLPARIRGDLAFERVSFRYNEQSPPVLDDFSLSVAAGETVALVGSSGAGKTTATHLLPRFYTPEQGTIRLDGDDIKNLTLESLRQQITLITQEALLFDDTVLANVTYPDSGKADQQRVMAALQNAAADFVNYLPLGVNTRIGTNGNKLSGGQKQRLALARAFYRDSPIIILDEATSALDSETESTIKESMRCLLAQRTALIITHRFATIDFADRVAVLDAGKIIAIGDVQTLRQTCPLFANLYSGQLLAQ